MATCAVILRKLEHRSGGWIVGGSKGIVLLVALGLATAASARAEDPVPVVPPLSLPRATEPPTIDGDLGEPAWRASAAITRFYDITFGDNRAPAVETRRLRHVRRARSLYIALACDDPEPAQDPRALRGPRHRLRQPGQRRRSSWTRATTGALGLRVPREPARHPGRRGLQRRRPATRTSRPTSTTTRRPASRSGAGSVEMRIPLLDAALPASATPRPGASASGGTTRATSATRSSAAPMPRGSNCFICHLHELSGSQRAALGEPPRGRALRERPGRRAGRRQPGAPLGDERPGRRRRAST